jgi:transketolase
VAIEAAISPGWDRYIGENGVFVGLKGFGLSAPGDVLFKHFGITAENVVTQTKAAFARRAELSRPRLRRFGMDVVA